MLTRRVLSRRRASKANSDLPNPVLSSGRFCMVPFGNTHLDQYHADTRLVSAADKLNNVRSILSDYRANGESIWARFNGGRTGTLWYYRVLLDAFLRHKLNRITRDFELAVNELEALAGTADSSPILRTGSE